MTEKYFVQLEYAGMNETIANTLEYLAVNDFKGMTKASFVKEGRVVFSFSEQEKRDSFAQVAREMYLEESIMAYCWDSQL